MSPSKAKPIDKAAVSEAGATHAAFTQFGPFNAQNVGRRDQLYSGGNLATQRMLRDRAVQAKLEIGQSGDSYEQEAERAADQVMRTAAGTEEIPEQPRQVPEESTPASPLAATVTPLVQRAPFGSSERSAPGTDFEARLGAGSGGKPLAASTRAFMEPRFGTSFSGVRVHSDGNAASLNREIGAQAFTHGSNIYFGDGASRMGPVAEKRLLAHELTHTIQQGAAGGTTDGAASQTVARSPVVQRQPDPAGPPPSSAPTPPPAGGVTPPSPPVPVVGASKAETDPVELPLVVRSLPITFTSTERNLVLTTEDLSKFELFKGEMSTPDIPIPELFISAKFSAKAQEGIRLADASLYLSPIEGVIEASQIATAQSGPSTLSKIAAGVGGIVGGLGGAVLGGIVAGPVGAVAGAAKGAGLGGVAGGQAVESLEKLFAGDKELKVMLTRGDGGVNLALTYSPELTMTLSAVGFSWLSTLETSLLTNLKLTAKPHFDFRGSSVSLFFRDGHLLPREFTIQPVVRPVFDASLEATAQLVARLVMLPFLRGEKPQVGEDKAIEAAEVTTAPFHLFTWGGSFAGDPLMNAVKNSPLAITKKNFAADEGKVPTAFTDGLKKVHLKGSVSEESAVPEDKGGSTPTGLTPNNAIKLTWWKHFDDYVKVLTLPASVFGTERKARPFPNRHYHNERLATDLSLGVDIWPYEGMTLKKRSNQRDSQTVVRFKEELGLHGVDLDRQAPGTDVDHVIDLVFDTGVDRDDNLWPLDSGINRRAGGKWIFGTYLVTWADGPGGPALNTTPADVPTGRWFVITRFDKP